MITINNNKYANNETEFINSLATTKTTCVGYYKRYKYKIRLLDKDRFFIGMINRFGVVQFIPKIENKINYPLSKQFEDLQKIKITSQFINSESTYTFK